MKCREIMDYIEKLCPTGLACDWDNVGLLVGNECKNIKKVLVSLDVDEYVVNEACEIGADMIISHHPVMFSPVNRLTDSDPQQRALRKICKNDICLYAAHTNMDCAIGGLNDYLACKLELKNPKVFEVTADVEGFGRFCELEKKQTLADMIKRCEEKLKLDSVRYVGEPERKIGKIVVNSGSGSDCLDKCIQKGVDLLITGDLKYSVARKAFENGVAVIDAGHYGTEIIFTELVSEYLRKKFPQLEVAVSMANISVIKTDVTVDK